MNPTLLAAVAVATTPGASAFFELKPAAYAQAPEVPSELLFAAGPHPICSGKRAGSALGDACALHAHLVTKAIDTERLAPIVKRVLERLQGSDRALLHARLLGAPAQRAAPCLTAAGSELFRAAEGRMIVQLQREALQAYARALRTMDRHRAAALLPELARLVRAPYEALSRGVTPPVAAGIDGQIDILPPGLIKALERLARSLNRSLPPAVAEPIRVATAQSASVQQPKLWLEGNELLLRAHDARDATRLTGEAATEALGARLTPDHPDKVTAALLAGNLKAAALRPQLRSLAEQGDHAGWVGLIAMGHEDDQGDAIAWLLKDAPELDRPLAEALERFSEVAGKRLRAIPPSRWPVPILMAMLRRSARFDLRPWYTAMLDHKDPKVRVLAHASMRKTKPEAWLTARLERHDRCAAAHLRLLMPDPAPPKSIRRADKPAAGIAEPIGAEQEIDDSAGSIEIPETAADQGEQP